MLKQWAGAVAGFVVWFPAHLVGLAVGCVRKKEGNEAAWWAEHFADVTAFAVKKQFEFWGWPEADDAGKEQKR